MSGFNDYIISPSKKKSKRVRVNSFFSGLNTAADQSVLPLSASPLTYNFDFSSGALRNGIGLSDLGLNTSLITDVWRYSRGGSADEEILMFARAGYIYYLRDGMAHQLAGVQTSGRIFATNYRLHGVDVVIIFSNSSPLIVWDGVNPAYTVVDSPRIRSMDAHEGLMFIADADGETVHYTFDLDPTNWNGPMSEGGSMILADGRGRIGKLVSFLSHLYVFRDYGISRIAIKDGQPTSAGLYVSSGRIYGDTVVLCGSKVVFLAEDGLYEFDGLNTKKVLGFLDGFILPDANARAAYQGGRYYLAARANFGGINAGGKANDDKVGCESGEYINNALISYSLSSGIGASGSVSGLSDGGFGGFSDSAGSGGAGGLSVSRGMDITALIGISGNIFVVCNGRLARLDNSGTSFGAPLKRVWKSPLSDLGSEKVKQFKEINIESGGDIILSLSTENGGRMVLVKGQEGIQRVRFNLRGKKVSFGIEATSLNAYITRPSVVYSEV